MFLIIITGYSGAGKTSLCKGYNNHKGLVDIIPNTIFYDKDDVNDFLTELFNLPLGTRDGLMYKSFVKPITYFLMEELARLNLTANKDLSKIESFLKRLFSNISITHNFEKEEILNKIIQLIKNNYLFIEKKNVILSGTYDSESNHNDLSLKLLKRWNDIAINSDSKLINIRIITSGKTIYERMKKRNSSWDKIKFSKGLKISEHKILGSKNLKPIYLNNEGSFESLLQNCIKTLKAKGVKINEY